MLININAASKVERHLKFLAGYNSTKRKTAMPKYISGQTFKQAEKVKKKEGKQGDLGI